MTFKKAYKLFFWIVTITILLLGVISTRPKISGQGASSPLLINEIMASNGTGLTDEDGDYSDWIEIYNTSNQPVNLAGWSLTDDLNQPQKWPFPNITLAGQEYLVVIASGKNRASAEPGSTLHTNFKLRKSGGPLALYNILEDNFKDVISPQYPQQFRDISYGHYGDQSTYGYLTTPTPGQPNAETLAWEDVVSTVAFNPKRGFYEAPFTVELKTTTPGAVVRYTMDGSEPTETSGTVYTEPVSVSNTTLLRAAAFKPGSLPSAIKTHTYIFLDDITNQSANPAGWPATWGVYLEYYPGLPLKGAPVPADYGMDSRIVKDSRFSDTIKDDFKSIPTLSIVTDQKNFDIYIRALERGEAWERPVSVEFFDPNDDNREFQINAGLRMQGVTARWEYMPKKSFRLFFKGKYGATKLEYPLFPDSSVDEFDTLVLRGGVNRSYAGYIDAVDYTQVTYTRDEWMRASQIAMSGVGSHGIFVHLYLNGLYWGLYNVVERPDASFISSYLGGRKEDWFAIKHGATILNPDEVAQGGEIEFKYGEEISGSNERYERLHELAGLGDLADPEKYAAITPYIDTAQFSDYVILNLYAGNNDWNDNNWYANIRNTPPGQLKYFVWDAEQTWNNGARLYLGKTTPHHKIRPLFLALMENPDFRIEFADRIYKNLFNNGPLTDENSQARWIRINQPIEQAIVGESARWGDTRYTDDPINRDDWVRARDGVLAQMEGNSAKFVAITREAGYYPDIDPPVFNQRGGSVPSGFELTMAAADGTIYYTTDGSDPQVQVTGAVAPNARLYGAPLVLTKTTLLKSRALDGDTWSALNEATFRIDEAHRNLQITEIMYNPTGGNDYEFIELKNTGNVDLDLSNVSFEGINFTFPPNAEPLAPGQLIVLARDPVAFGERYPGVSIAGIYGGQLSNQGEKISLADPSGQSVVSVAYDDGPGWPVSADGRGDSLVLVNLLGDPNDPKSWRASVQPNGSPGVDDSQ